MRYDKVIGLNLISEEEIRELLHSDIQMTLNAVKNSFHYLSEQQITQPPKTRISRITNEPILDDWLLSMSAYICGEQTLAGTKLVSRYPGANNGHVILILNDSRDNRPIAIFDGNLISAYRTFAITPLSINFCNLQPEIIAIVGMGTIGKLHIEILPRLYPSIKEIKCFSFNAKYDDYHLNTNLTHCDNISECIAKADVVVTCGQKRPPYITLAMLDPRTKLIVNLSLFDFDHKVIRAADKVLIDDFCALEQSISPAAVEYREQEASEQFCDIGPYINGHQKIKDLHKFIFINTLGMVSQDLLLANEILPMIKQRNDFLIR